MQVNTTAMQARRNSHLKPALNTQRGAVLIMALILMTISVSLGVITMKDTIFGEQITANKKFQQDVFQSAESAIQSTINDATLNTAYNNNSRETTVQHVSDGITEASATLRYTGTGLSVGSSLSQFTTLHFSSTGRATISNVDASSEIVQGSSRLAPAL